MELTALFNEIDEYQPPTIDIEKLTKRQEIEKTFIYLAAVDSSYERIKPQILIGSELPDLESVMAMV